MDDGNGSGDRGGRFELAAARWAPLIAGQKDRIACLYPALLVLLPILATIPTWGFGKSPATLMTAMVCIYLMATVPRMLGKACEEKLFATWGGAPAVQLLRHRDGTIDSHTKARYHRFLAGKTKIAFPTREEELALPEKADEIYRAGVTCLLEKVGDQKRFAEIGQERGCYDFHRNGFGLRWIGRLTGLGSLAWYAVALRAYDLARWSDLPADRVVATIVTVAISALWMGYFTEDRVRLAAEVYAHALLRSCKDMR